MEALVELRLEKDRAGGEWRHVVVPERFLLWNLHRLAHHVFSKRPSESTIDAMKVKFSYQGSDWDKKTDLKTSCLDQAPGNAFLKGGARQKMQYSGGTLSCSIVAIKRSHGSADRYMPRCIKASDEADLDAINGRLLVTRYVRNMQTNRQKKKPPAVYCDVRTPAEKLWAGYMSAMRGPVDWEEKQRKQVAKAVAKAASAKGASAKGASAKGASAKGASMKAAKGASKKAAK